MSKTLFLLFTAVAFAFSGFIQTSTHAITVEGKVKSGQRLEQADLEKFPVHTIGDVVITNHKGEAKGAAKGLKGILLRDVLQHIALDTDNPKLFSEYYFVCKATDGYKVVYSWNELFNTEVGNTAYIVLEKEGKSLAGTKDAILMVSPRDLRTGRRYVKNLGTILVGRAE